MPWLVLVGSSFASMYFGIKLDFIIKSISSQAKELEDKDAYASHITSLPWKAIKVALYEVVNQRIT